jgi:hypothetical protein
VTGIETRLIAVRLRPMTAGAKSFCARRWVEPRTMKRKSAISTTSVDKTGGQRIAARREIAVAVRGKAARLEARPCRTRRDRARCAAAVAPATCAADIGQDVGGRKPAGDRQAHGNGRVHVPAGNAADRIDHGHQREAGGKGNAEQGRCRPPERRRPGRRCRSRRRSSQNVPMNSAASFLNMNMPPSRALRRQGSHRAAGGAIVTQFRFDDTCLMGEREWRDVQKTPASSPARVRRIRPLRGPGTP